MRHLSGARQAALGISALLAASATAFTAVNLEFVARVHTRVPARLGHETAKRVSCRQRVGTSRARVRQGAEVMRPRAVGDPLLMPANESLHFLKGDGAIVVGIHGLEDALVSRLKLLQ